MGRTLLVTGGAGFIGSNYVHYVLGSQPEDRVVVLDKLTYAGNLDNLKSLVDDPRYHFVQGDICDAETVARVLDAHGVDAIVNFAAETHVDRSIADPDAFIRTDVLGTHTLLEAARERGMRYHQVSTDEVYGHVPEGASVETDPLEPRSPYAASKAGGDLLVNAYFVTYGLHTTITRGSNNIGPFQYPEKVLPLFATNAMEGEMLPVYGDGLQERDYQWVGDHCEAIDLVLRRGAPGEAYNVGTGTSITNMEMTQLVLETLGKDRGLIRHVADRPGHDRRYCIDTAKIRALGWRSRHTPQEAIRESVRWYVDNEWWWRPIKSGAFKAYYQEMYGSRGDYQAG
ncbi:MAG: dTDP-glucose 4,6-dehydratase [Caldilineae bacterium]|nr:dTDP-glucose 4,6-dehydratase [Chloroflexota bacterium]MCB9176891.1 dTDP-glucose 4,6-dehydratase [Caldilineae bacterium]